MGNSCLPKIRLFSTVVGKGVDVQSNEVSLNNRVLYDMGSAVTVREVECSTSYQINSCVYAVDVAVTVQ